MINFLDGAQHLHQAEYDAQRSDYLQMRRYRVIRFWNSDVAHNIQAVLLVILDGITQEEV